MSIRSSRRHIGRVLLAGVAVVTTGTVAWWFTRDFNDGAAWAAVTSLLCGFAQAALSIADYLRRNERSRPETGGLVDNLAQIIEEQWVGEVTARQLRDPRVLPLAWSSTTDDLPAPPGRVVRDRLAGRLDGRFDDVIGQLVAGYRQIPSGRLVVLGEPGAGKSVLTILLTLGLLKTRVAGTAVPVLLTASSWDPVRESLDDWVVHTLADSYYAGRSEIPRRLQERRMLIPILDGLDEIPEAARRGALRALNRAVGADHPVVVTCRTTEYAEVVIDGSPTLRHAPVVRVLPVPPEDVIGYLSQVDWPEGTAWNHVYANLREQPDGAVAAALSTPLMIALARMVYQRMGGDPAELLDTTRFDSRHAVEDHLTDRVVDAAYAPDLLPSGESMTDRRPRWTAQQARGWLTFLAVYLHRHRERDLAWWLLSHRLLSPWVAPAIGISGGITLMALTSACIVALAPHDPGDEVDVASALLIGAYTGITVAILAIVIWYAGAGRAPGRLSFALRGSLSRLRRGFLTGSALIALVVVPALLVAAVIISTDGWSLRAIGSYAEALVGVAALAGAVGLALAVHNWLDAPPVRAAQASPQGFIRQDRRSSWVGALAAGLVFAVTAFPALAGGVIIGSVASQWLTGWPGWPGRPNLAATATNLWQAATAELSTPDSGSTVLLGSVFSLISGLIFALLVLLSRAWPRFAIARLLLAVRGRLPFHLLAFLADARDRQLVRQAGGAYQFRHARLQERLADPVVRLPGGQVSPTTVTGSTSPARSRRRVLAAIVVAVVLAATVNVVVRLPQDTSQLTLAGHTGDVNAVVFSRDGQFVATAGDDGTARLWQAGTGRLLSVLSGHTDSVTAVAFSPDARIIATASDDNIPRLWRVGADRSYATLRGLTETVSTLLFSPDGRSLATTTFSRTIQLWNVATGLPIATFNGYTAFSPDGSTVATASDDGAVQLLNAVTGGVTATLADPTEATDATVTTVDDITFSPDGRILAVGASSSDDDPVRLWDIPTGRMISTFDRRDGPAIDGASHDDDVVFSLDGRTVTTVGLDGAVQVWNPSNGQHLDTVAGLPVNASTVMLAAGGTAVAIKDDDGALHLCDITTGGPSRTLMNGVGGSSDDLVFSPDGRILATFPDDTVQLWSAVSGELIGALNGHTDSVTAVVFSPTERIVATASYDRTVRLWKLPSP